MIFPTCSYRFCTIHPHPHHHIQFCLLQMENVEVPSHMANGDKYNIVLWVNDGSSLYHSLSFLISLFQCDRIIRDEKWAFTSSRWTSFFCASFIFILMRSNELSFHCPLFQRKAFLLPSHFLYKCIYMCQRKSTFYSTFYK